MVDEAMARLNQNMAQQNMEHMDSLPEVLRHWVMSDESDGLVATQVWQIYLQMGRDIPSTLSDLRRRVAVFRSQTRQAMVRR